MKSFQLKFAAWVSAGLLLISGFMIILTTLSFRKLSDDVIESSNDMIIDASNSMQGTILETVKQQLIDKTKAQAYRTESHINVAMDTSRTIAQLMVGLKAKGASASGINRDRIILLIRGIIEKNPNFMAVYTGWEKDQFDGNAFAYENQEGHDETGRFIPYLFRDRAGMVYLLPMVEYENSNTDKNGIRYGEYYLAPREENHEFFIGPYQKKVGDEIMWIVSLVAPINLNDRFYGIAGVDMRLELLQQLAEEVSEDLYHGKGHVSFISNTGIVAADSEDKDNIGLHISALRGGTWELESNYVYSTRAIYEKKNGTMSFYYPLKIGKITTPWMVEIKIPEEIVMAEAAAIEKNMESDLDKIKVDLAARSDEVIKKQMLFGLGLSIFVFLTIIILVQREIKTRRNSEKKLREEIIEREQAERELKDFAQRLAIHIEQTPLGVIEWDPDFKVTQWNNAAEKIFGYSPAEAIGQTGLELIVPEEEHMHVESVWNNLVNGRGGGIRSTNKNITKERQIITCEWYNTTLLDDKGALIGVASLVQDISERIQFEKEKSTLEKQLLQSNKMEAIGTLAGGIAHDFNNILGIILGYTEILKEELAGNISSSKDLDEIINAVNRAKDLVSQILDYSRQNKKEFISIKPDNIINEALKMLRSSIPTTINIECDIVSSDHILGDPTQFHQIIMNLCTNAYHAMRKSGGTLKVLLDKVQFNENDLKEISLALSPGPYVKLEISDNGHGMDKTTQEKIFDPYFTTKKTGEGTGLGLSVVHGIVKNFGGAISFKSELGKGTTFCIYFPQIALKNEQMKIGSEVSNPTGNEHILLVDDEKSIVNMETTMLESLGYQVSASTNSVEAFKTFQSKPGDIDLVITDITMPDMTGMELLQGIRAIRPDIPVILCSGYSDLISEEQAIHINLLKYLKKPLLKRDIAFTVRELLDLKNEQ